MYTIETRNDHLLVRFEDDFNYPLIQTIMRHETMMHQYPHTNDIWHVGGHRANIRLGELESMVREFQCMCPTDATRTQTAVVVDEGLTGSILELFVSGLQKRVAFEIRTFQTLEDAQAWMGLTKQQVA